MRINSSGSVGHFDLAGLLSLTPLVVDEWVTIKFLPTGELINPLTGLAQPEIRLVSGTHRKNGAVYALVSDQPRMELQDDRREAFRRELEGLNKSRANQSRLDDHFARRREAMVEVGRDQSTMFFTLVRENRRSIEFEAVDEQGNLHFDLEIQHRPNFVVKASGKLDMTAKMRHEGAKLPGCLPWLTGGTATMDAEFDSGAFMGRTKKLASVSGRAQRFPFEADALIDTRRADWPGSIDVKLEAKGLGRIIVLIFGKKIGRSVQSTLDQIWEVDGEFRREAMKGLDAVDRGIAKLGDREFVRLTLWDSGALEEALADE